MSTLVARLLRFAVLVMILLGLTNPANADIIEISVPVNSQAPQSRPAIDNVWSVASQGGTLPTTLGIGIIVNSSWVSVIDFMDFALHQNPDFGTAPYTGLHFPPPVESTVTYRFDKPTVVSGVEIVQHANGVTQISGMLDNKSLGTVFGPAGDVTSGFVAGEGESQVFNFANKTVSGKEFKLTITKSNYPTAFAIHRAFPLDSQGSRITPASGPSQGGPVGGLVHGVSGTKAITCSNLTTGQSITFSISHMSWNCEANGLTVGPGDLVEQKALATK